MAIESIADGVTHAITIVESLRKVAKKDEDTGQATKKEDDGSDDKANEKQDDKKSEDQDKGDGRE